MPIKAADILYTLRADLSGLKQGLASATQSVRDHAAEWSTASRAIGIGMTAAGGAIIGFVGKSVQAFAESEKAEAQLNAVLKSTGQAAGLSAEELKGMAAELQKLTVYEDDTVIGAQSLLLTFTSIGRDVFPEAIRTILDMSTALGQDLKSSTIQVGKALNDPITGVTALQRVGVSFTESQKEQIKTLVETGHALDAQRLILAELGKEFGGSAAAEAQTFSGQLQQMKNEFGDLMEMIGEAAVPMLRELMSSLRPLIEQLAQWIKANPELAATITKVVTVIGGIFIALGPLLIALPGLISLFGALSTTVIPAVGAVLAALTGPVGIAIAAVAAVVAAGVLLYQNWEEVKEGLKAIWEKIKEVFVSALEGIGHTVGYLMGLIVRAVMDPIGTIKAAWEAVVDVFHWACGLVGDAVDWVVDKFRAVIDWAKGAWEWIKKIAGAIGGGFAEGFSQGAQGGPPQFAGGGVMPRTGFAIVGEAGPELVRLPRGAEVFDNRESRAMVQGGQGVNLTVNLGGVTVREEADIDRISQRLARRIGEQLRAAGAYA